MPSRTSKRRRNNAIDAEIPSSTTVVDESADTGAGTATITITTTTTTTTTTTSKKAATCDKKKLATSAPAPDRPSRDTTTVWNPVRWLPEKQQSSPTCHKRLLTNEDYRNLGFLPIAAFVDTAATDRCECRVYCIGRQFNENSHDSEDCSEVIRVDTILIITASGMNNPVLMRTTITPLVHLENLVIPEGSTTSCSILDRSIGTPLCMSDLEMFQVGCYQARTVFDTSG